MPKTNRFPFRADLRAKLIEVASRGETISYLELGAGRAMIGRYLFRIAREEAHAERPPLTSVVVRKDKGLPGEGFIEAMVQVGYTKHEDATDERGLWDRAFRETYEYWRPKLGDDLKRH
jgi:hypothetical protein